TLHALWPFLWIWAMLYRPERGWGFAHGTASESDIRSKMDDLLRRIRELEARDKHAELPTKPGHSRNSRSPQQALSHLQRAPNGEPSNGTPADPDLRGDLRCGLQDLPQSGQQMDAAHGAFRRHLSHPR